MLRTLKQDVCAQHGEVGVEDVALVGGASSLDFVVAQRADLAAHVVEHLVGQMDVGHGDRIIVIRGRLALDEVAVINVDEPVAPRRALFSEIALDACQTARCRAVGHEVVGVVVAMDVAGAHNAEFNLPRSAGGEGKQRRYGGCKKAKKGLFHDGMQGVFGFVCKNTKKNRIFVPESESFLSCVGFIYLIRRIKFC